MIKVLLFSILMGFLGSSCSPYIKYLEGSQSKQLSLKQSPKKKLYCEDPPPLNIVHDSEFTQKGFIKIINRLKSRKKYSISELGLLYYLYQMNVRPDATDENSRIQIVIRSKGKLFYRDFFNPDGKNLQSALATLQKEKLVQLSLKQLIKVKEKTFPKKYIVQGKLNEYLESKKTNAAFRKQFNDTFFRLDKPLQKGESYRSPFKISSRSSGKYSEAPPLFELKKEGNNLATTRCNFDSALYQKGIFLLNQEKSAENIFGLLEHKGDSIFFITRKGIEKEKKISSIHFPGKATSTNAPICFHQTSDITLDLIGFDSRDSGQILYHLFNYGIDSSKSIDAVVEYLIFPRHQFLTNPARLLYESKRGTSSQLTYFLSFDFPVYHVDNLAVVYALFKVNGQRTFIGDTRLETVQSCQR